ncbi:MAG TPA: hypothetical protein VM076_05760 [Gemmatimonadaceae bacterium]|nr:hypothetical protein [Gemmatimonadaceae bacterium]
MRHRKQIDRNSAKRAAESDAGESILGRILPPDPKAPPRPTVPPPTCGTLPPALPSLPELLGGLWRIGR